MERRQGKKDEDVSNEDAPDEPQVSGQDPQNPENWIPIKVSFKIPKKIIWSWPDNPLRLIEYKP